MPLKTQNLCVILLLLTSRIPFASSSDQFASVRPQDKTLLEPAIKRFSQDQIKHNWADLWEIDEQDIDTKRDFLLKDDAPAVPKKEYVERKEGSIASGGVPLVVWSRSLMDWI